MPFLPEWVAAPFRSSRLETSILPTFAKIEAVRKLM
jgi:hypothetical protein